MKLSKVKLLLVTILCLSFFMTACGGSGTGSGSSAAGSGTSAADSGSESGGTSGEKIKVGFIYIGPVGDAGWTTAHDNGRKYLEENLDSCETMIVENVPESADSERVMTELVKKGCKVIFATSFGYMDYVQNVAKKFPDVTFMHCSGYKVAENVGTYFGQIEQPRYLSGMIAGKSTKSNTIGYVAAHPIPEVIRGINAFTLGVRAVNPDAKVKVIWTNTWYDPAKEKDAALSLIDAKCDVIAQHQDTPGPQQAAEEKGVFAIGYNTDMNSFAPKANLTSPIWNWGPYYVDVVKGVQDKTWKNDQYWGDMADGVVELAPINASVPADVKKLAEDKQKEMEGRTFSIFEGPLKDNTGAEKIKSGQKMTDQEILEMNWFVEGVDGEIPQ